MSYGCEKLSIPFIVENVILKALYCAVQVVKSFYTFVVENEGSVLRCESRGGEIGGAGGGFSPPTLKTRGAESPHFITCPYYKITAT